MKTFATIVTALVAGVLLASGGTAAAQEALHPSKLDASFKGLTFGATKDQVATWLRSHIAQRFETAIEKTLDVREKDRLTREKTTLCDKAGSERYVFDGTRTGWDVSVIQGEFGHGGGEELIHEADATGHLYFFFVKDSLYKVVRTSGDRPMSTVVAELQNAYGPPKTAEFLNPATKDAIGAASWHNGLLALAVEDRMQQYQTVIVRWALRSVDDSLRAERAKNKADTNALNPLIRMSQEAPASDEVDPIDAMIGTSPAPAPKDVPVRKKKKGGRKGN